LHGNTHLSCGGGEIAAFDTGAEVLLLLLLLLLPALLMGGSLKVTHTTRLLIASRCSPLRHWGGQKE
jgi:hypothetical protein